jgi:hypothetical protein
MYTRMAQASPVVAAYGRNMDEPKRRRDQQMPDGPYGRRLDVAHAALFRSVFHEK